jgi:hypothetical protein
MAIERICATAVVQVAVDGNLMAARWTDSPQPADFRHLVVGSRRAAPHGKVALLDVIDAKGKLPRFDDEIRQAARAATEETIESSLATAHVVLMDGFTGATVRMFLSGMLLVGRRNAPVKVFASIDEGVSWLVEQGARDGARLRALYESLKS